LAGFRGGRRIPIGVGSSASTKYRIAHPQHAGHTPWTYRITSAVVTSIDFPQASQRRIRFGRRGVGCGFAATGTSRVGDCIYTTFPPPVSHEIN
jgi:hypothetical protein